MSLVPLSEFMKASVDANDQLLFKVFLLLLNVMTVLGQYVWNTVIA